MIMKQSVHAISGVRSKRRDDVLRIGYPEGEDALKLESRVEKRTTMSSKRDKKTPKEWTDCPFWTSIHPPSVVSSHFRCTGDF